VITSAVAGPFVLPGGQLEIDSDLTIDGGIGVVIDANGTLRVARVNSPGDLTLENLTITAGDDGGAIQNWGGLLTVADSTVTGNRARTWWRDRWPSDRDSFPDVGQRGRWDPRPGDGGGLHRDRQRRGRNQ